MRQTRLAIGSLALFVTACAAPSQYVFESGSPEDMAARYIAEWGGQAGQYRAIFESDNCQRLADSPIGVPWDGPLASHEWRAADLDTPEGREQTGYIHARRERLAQLGCTDEPPPLPPG
jgi:hypothetical protein